MTRLLPFRCAEPDRDAVTTDAKSAPHRKQPPELETAVTKLTNGCHRIIRVCPISAGFEFEDSPLKTRSMGGRKQEGATSMKVYHRLAAGAALGAIAMTAAVARRRQGHRSTRPRASMPPIRATPKIRALKPKFEALTQRLDAAGRCAAERRRKQAQSAQAAAAAAQTRQRQPVQAAAALTQTQATQVQVAQRPKGRSAAREGDQRRAGLPTRRSAARRSSTSATSTRRRPILSATRPTIRRTAPQTELKRFYIGVDHKFNDVFSANLTTDFRYNTNGTSNDVLVYVKKAYLQAKLIPAFTVRVGAADLPWVPFVEGVYGYRFVENTLIDRTKFGTSSDWGVHVLGAFGPTASSATRSRRSTAPATRRWRATRTRSTSKAASA